MFSREETDFLKEYTKSVMYEEAPKIWGHYQVYVKGIYIGYYHYLLEGWIWRPVLNVKEYGLYIPELRAINKIDLTNKVKSEILKLKSEIFKLE